MPNFHVHWLVAWKALDKVAGEGKLGRDAWVRATQEYRTSLHEAFNDLATSAPANEKEAKQSAKDLFENEIPKLSKEWRKKVHEDPETLDHVTCFSAYMLGACGPDFWTCPAYHPAHPKPQTAGKHFDLGHYNRTHEQFRRSIEAVGGEGNAKRPQARIERWYFAGMATHVAADLVVHELVNVSAGAYNLLKKDLWEGEHPFEVTLGTLPGKIWNAHNKVEHFWDSFVRYRYFGDLPEDETAGLVAKGDSWIDPLGFPLTETVVRKVKGWKDSPLREEVLARLVNPEAQRSAPGAGRKGKPEKREELRIAARVLIEAPLVFTAIAADRLLGQGVPQGLTWKPTPLDPFIYDRVVHKTAGAYPAKLIFQAAIDEAAEDQMRDPGWLAVGKLNERRRVQFFATEKNSDQSPWGYQLNYLNFAVCPDLERLKEDAPMLGVAFTDPGALKGVGTQAVGVAATFANRVLGGYASKDPDTLREVGLFWNLDTGLGLEVQAGKTFTEKELVTRLDFVHVLSNRVSGSSRGAGTSEGDLGYRRDGDPANIAYLAGKKADDLDVTTGSADAFPVWAGGDGVERPFESLEKVQEPGADRFLDRIRLAGEPTERWGDLDLGPVRDDPSASASARAEKRTQRFLDRFFQKEEHAFGWSNLLGSVSVESRRVFALQQVRERISLELVVPIPALTDDEADDKDDPGLFFYADEARGVADAATIAPHAWVHGERRTLQPDVAPKAKLLGYWSGGERRPGSRLRTFTARVLLNVRKSDEREVTAGRWNNVVPYGANKRFYGRNFAVATGRKLVLNPIGEGRFDPVRDFTYHAKVTPTEHVFLTLYPLVKTPWGVVDAFSDEEVSRGQMDELRKISGLEWKKVVLFYHLTRVEAPPAPGAGGGAKKAYRPALVQLKRCLVDGLDTPVVAVPSPAGAAGQG